MLIMVTEQLRKPLREIAKTFMSVSVLVVLICPLPMMYSAPVDPTIRALCEVENMSAPVT